MKWAISGPRLVFIAMIFMGVTTICMADEEPITGLFSNMRMSDEEGDVIGMEIFIVNSKSGLYAMVQCSSGEPYEPFLTKVKTIGNKIKISFPSQTRSTCGADEIVGTLTKDGLDVAISQASQHWLLKRGHGFWSR